MPDRRRVRVAQDDGRTEFNWRMGVGAAGPAANQRSGRSEPSSTLSEELRLRLHLHLHSGTGDEESTPHPHRLRALDIISTRRTQPRKLVLRETTELLKGSTPLGVWMRGRCWGTAFYTLEALTPTAQIQNRSQGDKGNRKAVKGSCQSQGSCGKENELTPIAMNLGPGEA